MTLSHVLVALGLVLVALGLAGLGWCIRLARRVKGGEAKEAELQAVFARLSAVNMASMGGATLGLALVLFGLIL